MPIKIAMIGAGSVGFTRALTKDILAVPELVDTEFAFTDISKTNLEMVAALCKRDIKENKLPAKVRTSTNRIAMLEGADYVFCMIRQGGLEAFQTDIDIPLKYGVDQCVGDTLCAGGIMYAQRTIPALLELQGNPRGSEARRSVHELREPDGNEYLGLQSLRRRPDGRSLPRRTGRALANNTLH